MCSDCRCEPSTASCFSHADPLVAISLTQVLLWKYMWPLCSTTSSSPGRASPEAMPQLHKCSFCGLKGHNLRRCKLPGAELLRKLLAAEKKRKGTVSKNEGRTKHRWGGRASGDFAKKRSKAYTRKRKSNWPEEALQVELPPKKKITLASPNVNAATAKWKQLCADGFLKCPRKCRRCQSGTYGPTLYSVAPRVRKEKTKSKRHDFYVQWVLRCTNNACSHRLNTLACSPFPFTLSRGMTLEQFHALIYGFL